MRIYTKGGAEITEEEYNHRISNGAPPENFRITFNNAEDFDFDSDDYEELEELIFDGGADYGDV